MSHQQHKEHGTPKRIEAEDQKKLKVSSKYRGRQTREAGREGETSEGNGHSGLQNQPVPLRANRERTVMEVTVL